MVNRTQSLDCIQWLSGSKADLYFRKKIKNLNHNDTLDMIAYVTLD